MQEHPGLVLGGLMGSDLTQELLSYSSSCRNILIPWLDLDLMIRLGNFRTPHKGRVEET
jgi:hypothetical protein